MSTNTTLTRSAASSAPSSLSRLAPVDAEFPSAALDGSVAAALASISGRAGRVLTGDRPTGPLHLGHLLGSVQTRVALQHTGADLFVVIADYQTITDREVAGPIAQRTLGLLADQLACGLRPERTTFFVHSAVPEIGQLTVVLLALVSDAELRRNPTVKAELEASQRPLSGLLLTYPLHQAADILFCDSDLVPVGQDQLPHLEIARVVARRFNDRYGRVFAEPRALLSTYPVVPGLDGQKMSKSRSNSIPLSATEDETVSLIRRVVTDSERYITFAPQRRPGVAALLTLCAAAEGVDPRAVAEQVGNGGAAGLKSRTAEAVNELLRPIRARRAELTDDPRHLEQILVDGTRRAREVAAATLGRVNHALGTFGGRTARR